MNKVYVITFKKSNRFITNDLVKLVEIEETIYPKEICHSRYIKKSKCYMKSVNMKNKLLKTIDYIKDITGGKIELVLIEVENKIFNSKIEL